MKSLRKLVSTFVVLFIPCAVQASTITVSAAASLAVSLKTIKQQYNNTYPQDKIHLNFASSSVLARQIQYGAKADIFISANKKWTEFLLHKNQLEKDSVMPLVSNQLIIAKNNRDHSNKHNQACYDQASTQNFLNTLINLNQRIVVADMQHVPLGLYTRQTLTRLNELEQIQSNLIPSANARSTLAFVEQKQVEFAFLYYSDAINSSKVDILCIIPSDFHDPINYYMAKVNHTKSPSNHKAVNRFYQFLQSNESKNRFVEHGFLNNIQ